MSFVIAIDGPAGTGKGTITRIIAKRLNLINIDTGAMYRCVALECLRNKVLPDDEIGIEEILKNIDIKLINEDGSQKIFLNGVDVSEDIRTPEVDNCVAKYAAIKCVRDKMTPIQQQMGKEKDIIMEGRDIGTVVFPNADVKIFLDCSIEERALRRYKQNIENGISCDYNTILKEIKKRNILETTRKIAPFVKAKDAIVVDSTNMSINEVANEIEKIINKKRKEGN